ncbi:hypothetical protein GDO86_006303 [Hymenochirus boettgeri]|uniref:Uncharacterized protein n=1 Tax=Hymenochirus boettgeri TaxID=247094 RepID=A0A8T2J5J3_9PIPI|nr:hypothetical protein GDO86_006303 [Hymenochirus boettgeri]
MEVLGFWGNLLGAVTALKAAEYLLLVLCAVVAWKSGEDSHSELVNNLRTFTLTKKSTVVAETIAKNI